MNVANSAARDSLSGRRRLASIASSAAASRFDERSASARLASVVISALAPRPVGGVLPVVGEQSGDHGDDDETRRPPSAGDATVGSCAARARVRASRARRLASTKARSSSLSSWARSGSASSTASRREPRYSSPSASPDAPQFRDAIARCCSWAIHCRSSFSHSRSRGQFVSSASWATSTTGSRVARSRSATRSRACDEHDRPRRGPPRTARRAGRAAGCPDCPARSDEPGEQLAGVHLRARARALDTSPRRGARRRRRSRPARGASSARMRPSARRSYSSARANWSNGSPAGWADASATIAVATPSSNSTPLRRAGRTTASSSASAVSGGSANVPSATSCPTS